ncbi:hypothetical protein F4801DRAFT_592529 [Xylaria longipes]|nr:hypothetical protein F4801DRAFT_592529 [Xylaria longipes]RYC64294.1 hypothetical protein CHU98_g1911 [Xylaria longipes]
MSAFALRKKLLAQQSQVASPQIDQPNAAGTDTSTDTDKVVTNPHKKVRKTRATRHTSAKSEGALDQSIDLPPGRGEGSVELSAPSPSQVDQVHGSLSPFSLEEGEEDYHVSCPVQPVNLSSFRPSKGNFRKRSDGVTQLKLDEGERLVILGSYGVRVQSGEATIYGATLKASQNVSWVHAPQSHALPVIRCTSDTTLELHPHPCAQELKDLGLLSPLFRKLWWESPSSAPRDKGAGSGDTFRILSTSEDGPKKTILQDLKAPPEWNRATATLVASNDPAPPSIMITGPKSSGKSTFGKILTNRLLTSTNTHAKRPSDGGVVILDLDPGQPEYCGPGQIALILVTKPVVSPSFCRPFDTPGIRTIRSHALASLSPASDPDLYNEMALDLITHYRNAFRSYPLVINTPGWIQGTGLDLLVSLIGELRPSEVIYMSQTGPVDAVEALEGACTITRFSTLPSQPSQNKLRSAADLRSMQTMAYFHAQPPTPHNSGYHLRWFQTPLTAMAPWQVHFRGAGCNIFGVLCYDFQTQPGLVADAINGAVLAAVEVESSKAFRDVETHQILPNSVDDEAAPGSPMDLDMGESSQSKLPPLSLVKQRITTLTAEGIPFIDTTHGLTLDPRYSRSLGLVLVRGIDIKNGDFHLLCPITTNQVEGVTARGGQIVLVSGRFDPPSWAYTEDLHFQSKGEDGDGNEGVGPDSQTEPTDDAKDNKGDNTTTSYSSAGSVPWIEILTRNQKRGAGSKVWRVRRDLGRAGNPGD